MEYCTIQDAAKILKVSRPTVYRMIRDGELKKPLTILGRPAFKVSDIKRKVKQNGDKA